MKAVAMSWTNFLIRWLPALLLISVCQSALAKRKTLFPIKISASTRQERISGITRKKKHVYFSNRRFPKAKRFDIFYVLSRDRTAVIAELVVLAQRGERVYAIVSRLAPGWRKRSLRKRHVIASQAIYRGIFASLYFRENPTLDLGYQQSSLPINSIDVATGANLAATAITYGAYIDGFIPESRLFPWLNWIGASASYEAYSGLGINIKRSQANVTQETVLSGDRTRLRLNLRPHFDFPIYRFTISLGIDLSRDRADLDPTASGADASSLESSADAFVLGGDLGLSLLPYIYLGGKAEYVFSHEVTLADSTVEDDQVYSRSIFEVGGWISALFPFSDKLKASLQVAMTYRSENVSGAELVGSGENYVFDKFGLIRFNIGLAYAP